MIENKKNLGMVELELALFWISKQSHPYGGITWKDLALQMAEVAREALEQLDAKRGSESCFCLQ
jgi:hypothetical protein